MIGRDRWLRVGLAGGFTLVIAVFVSPSFGMAKQGKIFAQQLLEETLPKHPEVTGLEMSATSRQGCKTIASTDPKDLGEKCDQDEWQPLRTGKPYVEQESDGFDVTLPLHDASGKTIAVVGMDFKPEPGQTKRSVVKQGRQIVSDMEKQVSSKAKLFEQKD